MAQAAKGQEPSMEEILASIRRIIADEPAQVSRNEGSRQAISPQEILRQEILRQAISPDAISRNDSPRRDGLRNESPRMGSLRDEGLRAEDWRSESPSYESSRHESPLKSIAQSEDGPQARGPILPQPPSRVAPPSSRIAPEPRPPIPSLRAAPAPVPDPATQQQEMIDAMLAELNIGSRQAPAVAEEPASDILDLTEQMEAPESLPAAELASPDDLADGGYEEETPTEAPEEPPPVAMAQAAAEPPRHMRDRIRDVERESGRNMPEPGLISAATTAAVDSAFNTLAQTVLVQNGRTLEDLVRELLRPMLKIWLDDNLPTMVERLVRAEIDRISRGRP
jgi:cell pole-organizing protein PopZ